MGIKVQGKIFFEVAAFDGKPMINQWRSYNRDEIEDIYRVLVERNMKSNLYSRIGMVSRYDNDSIFEEIKTLHFLPKKS